MDKQVVIGRARQRRSTSHRLRYTRRSCFLNSGELVESGPSKRTCPDSHSSVRGRARLYQRTSGRPERRILKVKFAKFVRCLNECRNVGSGGDMVVTDQDAHQIPITRDRNSGCPHRLMDLAHLNPNLANHPPPPQPLARRFLASRGRRIRRAHGGSSPGSWRAFAEAMSAFSDTAQSERRMNSCLETKAAR